MDRELLERVLADAGEPAYRARQVWAWAAGGASGYEEMTNLPVALRTTLAERVPFSTLTSRRGARERRHGEGALPDRATAALSRPC